MSGIEELQQRVAEAEERFGLIATQRAKYSDRLVGLIDAVETRLMDQQAEIERQAGEVAAQGEELELQRKGSAENQALRGMLHSLLCAIEAGGRDVLSDTMQAMDAKISALLAGPAAPQAQPEAPPGADVEISEHAETIVAEPEKGSTDDLGEPPEELIEEDVPMLEIERPDELDRILGSDPVQELDGEAETPPEPETIAEAPEVENAEAAAMGDEPAAHRPDEDAPDHEMVEMLAADPPEDLVILEDPESAEMPEAPAEPAASPGLENLIDEDAAVPGIAPAGDVADKNAEAPSLEDIMRRVSKLVEDEGALGPLSAGGVRIEAEAEAPETETPESETLDPAPVQQSASTG